MDDSYGCFLVRIRKDGTILLPKELGWQPGTMTEIRGYGFDGVISLMHIRNQYIVNQREAQAEKVR
jgi:hypothetical protein